jgi:hypothetical protein
VVSYIDIQGVVFIIVEGHPDGRRRQISNSGRIPLIIPSECVIIKKAGKYRQGLSATQYPL